MGICYHEGQRPGWRLDFIVNRFVRPFQLRLDRLIEDMRVTRPVSPTTTGALLALLVHGVGSYYALRPLHKLLEEKNGKIAREQAEEGKVMARLVVAGVLGGS